jgi:hypothetical protein
VLLKRCSRALAKVGGVPMAPRQAAKELPASEGLEISTGRIGTVEAGLSTAIRLLRPEGFWRHPDYTGEATHFREVPGIFRRNRLRGTFPSKIAALVLGRDGGERVTPCCGHSLLPAARCH